MPLSKSLKLLSLSFFNHQVGIADGSASPFPRSHTYPLTKICHPRSMLVLLQQHSRGTSPAGFLCTMPCLLGSALIVQTSVLSVMYLVPSFFAFLCFLLVIPLFGMAPKHSAESPQTCGLDKLHPDRSERAAGPEFNASESKYKE